MRRLVAWIIAALCLSACAGDVLGGQPVPELSMGAVAPTPTPQIRLRPSPTATSSPAPSPTSAPPTATASPTPSPTVAPLPELSAPAELVDLRLAGVSQARSGLLLRREAVADLTALLEAASLDGFDLEVRSAYRSYADQSATFERWVEHELASARKAGAPIKRAVAEQRAAGYSAAPGRSEHQTGLTVDLLPSDAPDIGFVLSDPLREWLAANAYRFGWVQSYPVKLRDNVLVTKELTGYTSEPWHWRWQGRAAAAALYAEGYLAPESSVVPPPLPLVCDADHDPCVPVAATGSPAWQATEPAAKAPPASGSPGAR